MENRRVSMNRHTNLLQLEEHMYPLVDVATPNVFRNLFPYSEVPKIAFNDRVVPHHMPDDIWITDTTFRDGQQSRAPYSTEQIVRIYDYLHKLGGPRSFCFRVNSPFVLEVTAIQKIGAAQNYDSDCHHHNSTHNLSPRLSFVVKWLIYIKNALAIQWITKAEFPWYHFALSYLLLNTTTHCCLYKQLLL